MDEQITRLMDQAFSFNTTTCNKQPNICRGNEFLATTLSITKSFFERETHSTLFQIKHSLPETQRRKRELSIGKLIGQAMHNWFEIATNDDIGKLVETDKTLSTKINQINNMLETQNANLINFEQQANEL